MSIYEITIKGPAGKSLTKIFSGGPPDPDAASFHVDKLLIEYLASVPSVDTGKKTRIKIFLKYS